MTQPGQGAIRGQVRSNFYTSRLDGRNPLVDRAPPSRNLKICPHDGAFSVPATDLAFEWGPSSQDIRYRGSVSFGTTAVELQRNVRAAAQHPHGIRR